NGRETERKILSADGSRLLHTHSEYDEAGRLKKLVTSEAKWGDKQLGRAEIQYDYDAVGNRRRITTIHHQSDGQTATDVDWYAYDIDNRMTVSQGQLYNQKIMGGNEGSQVIEYDIMGRRKHEFSWFKAERNDIEVMVKQQTKLGYDNNGHLNSAVVMEYRDPHAFLHHGSVSQVSSMSRTNSLTGHAREQIDESVEYGYDQGRIVVGSGRHNKQTTRFGYTDGQLYSQTVRDKQDAMILQTSFEYHHSGQVKTQYSRYMKEGRTDTTTTEFKGWESYQRSDIKATSDGDGYRDSHTTLHYNAVGQLQRTASNQNENVREVLMDSKGQIALQLDNGKLSAQLAVGGNQLGNLTADKLDADLLDDSAAEVGTQPGAYTVRQGDTLQTVSQKVYGDSRYWYLIADANAMGPEGELTPGKSLIIPNQHTQSYNGAESFKPYNESDILGDINPNAIAPPPPSKSCNPIAMIVMA
ncbi:LysM peptidoglycan-binding domain-containing protein, partial [Motilimonas cestriensis]